MYIVFTARVEAGSQRENGHTEIVNKKLRDETDPEHEYGHPEGKLAAQQRKARI